MHDAGHSLRHAVVQQCVGVVTPDFLDSLEPRDNIWTLNILLRMITAAAETATVVDSIFSMHGVSVASEGRFGM